MSRTPFTRSSPLGRPRILIVEDGLIVAEDMRRRCESLGYRISAMVRSGEEAVDLVQMTKPDLVLMDIRLAGDIDGIEAARQIRTLLDIPVVFITSYSDDATLDRAKLTGPFGYMLKPVEPQELHTTIEMALHKHSVEAELRRTDERFRALLESSFDAIFVMDLEGRMLSCNQRCARMLGFTAAEELRGAPVHGFLNGAGTSAEGADFKRLTQAEGLSGEEVTLLRRDSSSFTALVNTRRVETTASSHRAVMVVIRELPMLPAARKPVSPPRRERPVRIRQAHPRA